MDAASLHARLANGPLLADGGMGTALIDAGVPVDTCMEVLNERAPARVAGNAATVFAPWLPFGAAHCIAEVGDRAGALLRLAQQLHDDGRGVDPADALPLYLRDKVALTTRERDAARGAGR